MKRSTRRADQSRIWRGVGIRLARDPASLLESASTGKSECVEFVVSAEGEDTEKIMFLQRLKE